MASSAQIRKDKRKQEVREREAGRTDDPGLKFSRDEDQRQALCRHLPTATPARHHHSLHISSTGTHRHVLAQGGVREQPGEHGRAAGGMCPPRLRGGRGGGDRDGQPGAGGGVTEMVSRRRSSSVSTSPVEARIRHVRSATERSTHPSTSPPGWHGLHDHQDIDTCGTSPGGIFRAAHPFLSVWHMPRHPG